MREAIFDVLSPVYMRVPTGEKKWRYIADDFEQLWDLPHCIGSLDGKHIRVNCPNNSGFFSVVLLAVCDAHYNFTVIDAGQFGSNNDSGVLKESNFGKAFEVTRLHLGSGK